MVHMVIINHWLLKFELPLLQVIAGRRFIEGSTQILLWILRDVCIDCLERLESLVMWAFRESIGGHQLINVSISLLIETQHMLYI
jgi:hypothetical protein